MTAINLNEIKRQEQSIERKKQRLLEKRVACALALLEKIDTIEKRAKTHQDIAAGLSAEANNLRRTLKDDIYPDILEDEKQGMTIPDKEKLRFLEDQA